MSQVTWQGAQKSTYTTAHDQHEVIRAQAHGMPASAIATEGTFLGLQTAFGSSLQHALEAHRKEEALELYRPDKQTYSRLLLETWLNEVLHDSSKTATGAKTHGPYKGLCSYSLDRPALLLAGLTEEGVSHLYRALYVYTMGFQDKVQRLFAAIGQKQITLNNVWRAYLAIAETAMKVGFKSLFLDSLAGQQQQAAEVALAQAAAREAVGERSQLEQMLTWLTGAHAEEAALHRTFQAEATGLKQHLMQEKGRGDDLMQQLAASQQKCLATEDDGRLLKRQMAVLAKARDVARQEKEDWKATCNSQEKLMQKVGSALVVVQDSCRTRPAEPEEAPLATAALGSEAGSRALLAQLDSLQAQAEALHGEWKSEKAQRIQLTERIIKQGAELSEQQLQNQAGQVRISVLEAGKGDLQAQLDDIEQARILPLQAIIDGLQQDVRGRDDALIEQQSRIAELQGQAEEAQERLETKRSKKQAYKQAFSGKVLVEKELRRQLLELDEHSGHLAQQLGMLTHHSKAMHTLTTGLITLQRSCAAQAGARRKVKGQLQEALARASQAEKDRAAAAAASATHLHDLEKLRRDANQAISGHLKSQQQQSMLQDQVTTSKEQVTRLTAERADALAEVADLKKSLKASEASAGKAAADWAAEKKEAGELQEQLQGQLAALDALRYDLEQAKAALTAKLEMASATNAELDIQILEAKAKAEQAQIMMNNTSDSCSRQVAQTYKELRLVRQEAQLLQGQLQTALGQLEQKRKKKRLYKAVLLRETEQLQAALVHKDVRIGELNYRIDKLKQALQALHDINDPPGEEPLGGPQTPRPASEALAVVHATSAASQAAILQQQLKQEEEVLQQRLAELEAVQHYEQDTDKVQEYGLERESLQRQLRQVAERITLAASQQQVEEAASSLTTLENLLQVEQAASLQSMQQAKARLMGQLQQAQAERDRYKTEMEQGHQQLLTAGQNQQNLQEQISFLEEERQTLSDSWKKAESARKFLQGEVAALKGQREKLKDELQVMTDKMVTLRDKPKTPPAAVF